MIDYRNLLEYRLQVLHQQRHVREAHVAQRASRRPQMVSPAHSAILETPYTVIDEKRIVRLVLRNTIVHCRLDSDPRCALDGRA